MVTEPCTCFMNTQTSCSFFSLVVQYIPDEMALKFNVIHTLRNGKRYGVCDAVRGGQKIPKDHIAIFVTRNYNPWSELRYFFCFEMYYQEYPDQTSPNPYLLASLKT